ncbi:MAG: trehalose-phosphatase [Micrococcales bacterium]|nr:trehalose-phosphatase [Micrococcales bacterium]
MKTLSWWPLVASRLNSVRPRLLALDFDGTLVPLMDNPDLSRTPPMARAALASLVQVESLQLALISGRPAADLARMADPPPGTLIAGSHGGELGIMGAQGVQLSAHPLSLHQRTQLAGIAHELTQLLQSHGHPKGAWIEHKPLAHALHTRLVRDPGVASALTLAAQQVGNKLGGYTLIGKNVVEIAVVTASKAGALETFRQSSGAQVVLFAGDDVTDEQALRTLSPPDVGIKVGLGPTSAEYRLEGPEQISDFLGFLASFFGNVDSVSH